MTSEPRQAVEDPSELIDRACRGDRDAFGRLVLRYRQSVRGLLHRLLGPDELDDREQEVFVAAWRGLGRFRGEASFETWLMRIAVNRASRVLRRRKPPPMPLADEPCCGRGGVLEALAARETGARLRAALESLPPKLRVAFVLRYVEGLSGEEVARVLEIPAATVRTRLHAARKKLSNLLGEEITE
ncbi:MAG: sigma-70 family RNA polymerase sigma factor [Planctomycetota bacterium]